MKMDGRELVFQVEKHSLDKGQDVQQVMYADLAVSARGWGCVHGEG